MRVAENGEGEKACNGGEGENQRERRWGIDDFFFGLENRSKMGEEYAGGGRNFLP